VFIIQKKEYIPLPFMPTIRITMKCTQECDHCCFACSPKETAMMEIETAKKIHKFLVGNEIQSINVMGGEFWLNPNWETIIKILIKDMTTVRLVTNGDWYTSKKTCEQIKSLLQTQTQSIIYIAISIDNFHTNTNVENAKKFCIDNNLLYTLGHGINEDGIIPVRKGYSYAGFYAGISMYCKGKCEKEGFMIDEDGKIFRCPCGIWHFDDMVEDFINGGWNSRWKQIIDAFRKTSIMSCNDCIRMENKFKKN
jgi:hypothetical protein